MIRKIVTVKQIHARLLGAHCRHSHTEIPRQCEADMSGKSVPHHEETGELETQRPQQQGYTYSLESNQLPEAKISVLWHVLSSLPLQGLPSRIKIECTRTDNVFNLLPVVSTEAVDLSIWRMSDIFGCCRIAPVTRLA